MKNFQQTKSNNVVPQVFVNRQKFDFNRYQNNSKISMPVPLKITNSSLNMIYSQASTDTMMDFESNNNLQQQSLNIKNFYNNNKITPTNAMKNDESPSTSNNSLLTVDFSEIELFKSIRKDSQNPLINDQHFENAWSNDSSPLNLEDQTLDLDDL